LKLKFQRREGRKSKIKNKEKDKKATLDLKRKTKEGYSGTYNLDNLHVTGRE
jgi:hypothetical protein